MGHSAVRILSILFVACFFGVQFAYASELKPESQLPLSYFAVESDSTTLSESEAFPFLEPKQYTNIKLDLAELPQLFSHKYRGLEREAKERHQADYPTPKIHQDRCLVTLKQGVTLSVQQNIHPVIQLVFLTRFRIFPPITDEPPASFS
ncbi:MAG: hypothetical protein ABJH28_02065 [Paraglaciecola sp.]|uniref:hypothetical protein n=1 Tax=Paraglaciecola sp. TaxID=1920173 RepID=UPI003267C7F4